MTDEQVFSVIRKIILRVTGVPICIIANPDDDPGEGQYCTVQPAQTVDQRGQANIETRGQGDQCVVDVKAQVIAECSINFYGRGARQFARKLFQANKRPDISEVLFRSGLGWMRETPVRNLTALQSAQQEERAQISIFLSYETSNPVLVNTIESVALGVQKEFEPNLIDTTVTQ